MTLKWEKDPIPRSQLSGRSVTNAEALPPAMRFAS